MIKTENNCYYSFLVVKNITITDKTKNYVINIKYNINEKYNYERQLINRISHFV